MATKVNVSRLLDGNIVIEATYERVTKEFEMQVVLVEYSIFKELERMDPETGALTEELPEARVKKIWDSNSLELWSEAAEELMGEEAFK